MSASQVKQVLAYMETRGPITTYEATYGLGITRLARCIHDIRIGRHVAKRVISDRYIDRVNAAGEPVRVKEYQLAPQRLIHLKVSQDGFFTRGLCGIEAGTENMTTDPGAATCRRCLALLDDVQRMAVTRPREGEGHARRADQGAGSGCGSL